MLSYYIHIQLRLILTLNTYDINILREQYINKFSKKFTDYLHDKFEVQGNLLIGQTLPDLGNRARNKF